MISAEICFALKRNAEQARKQVEACDRETESLYDNILEKSQIVRSISENLALIDEQKKSPDELVHENITKVIEKYDKEVTPRIDEIYESKRIRIYQSLDELNVILDCFNFIASYVVTCDTKIPDKE